MALRPKGSLGCMPEADMGEKERVRERKGSLCTDLNPLCSPRYPLNVVYLGALK